MPEGDRPETPSPIRAPKPSSVLLVTQFWGRDGGVGAHVKASAALLARHNIDVRVLAERVEPGEEEMPGVTVQRNPGLFSAGTPAHERLGEAFSLSPTAIHLHQPADRELVELMRTAAPVLISVHGYAACTSGVHHFSPGNECTRAHGPGCMLNLTVRGCAHTRHLKHFPAKYKQVTRGLESLRRADMVLAYSSAIDRHLAVNGLVRRSVIPLFATMTPKAGSGHAERRRVVFAGRVTGAKGPAVLIRAAQDVDAEFVICGEGRQLEAVSRMARQLGIQQRIRFTGWLDPEELAQELADASVVVVPSRWPEPFGLVGIEALAAGRPVIASATGGILDWLEDGVNGLSVRAGDASDLARALNELLDNRDEQQAMGAAGQKMVAARYSPERHVAALLESYHAARSTWQAAQRV
jgi:glycosyltransferase involved in cell wall biosynthesis